MQGNRDPSLTRCGLISSDSLEQLSRWTLREPRGGSEMGSSPWMREEAREDLEDSIERFYNRTRRHSHLGQVSPVEFNSRRNLT